MLGADGDYRRRCGEFLCDGDKLLRERSQAEPSLRPFLTADDPPDGCARHAGYRADRTFSKPRRPKTPQDVVFSCALPAEAAGGPAEGFQLILEGIQDPGNVGTILRTAGAFGAARVILTGGCADPYGPKAVRASMGAVFRQPIAAMDLNGIAALKEQGTRLYAAALDADCADVRDADYKNAAVAVGSEGRGLTRALTDLCDQKIKIPISEKTESLNAAVAAAIILWEASNRLLPRES
jgi:TrmH family RNA methyltransferase